MTKGWLNDDFDIPGALTVDDISTSSAGVAIQLAQAPFYSNLDVTLAAGVYTITGIGGTALSATNKGYVGIPSKTGGLTKIIAITANQAFTDDSGSSDITGNLFGFPTGVAVSARRFYGYAVLNDAETDVAFMLSRMSHHDVSPAAAAIGDPGDPVADDVGDFWSITTITEADYESNPCVCLFSLRMAMSTGDDWTVSAQDSSDGFGKNCDRNNFIPSTFSRVTTNANNVTGDGTAYTIIYGAEDIDTSLMAITTGIFTAPRDGYYEVLSSMRFEGLTTSHTTSRIYATSSGTLGDFENRIGNMGNMKDSGNTFTAQTSRMVPCNTGETMYVKVLISGGTKVVDISGGGSGLDNTSIRWVRELV